MSCARAVVTGLDARVPDVNSTRAATFFTQSFMVLANQSSYSSAKHVGRFASSSQGSRQNLTRVQGFQHIVWQREMYNLNCEFILILKNGTRSNMMRQKCVHVHPR